MAQPTGNSRWLVAAIMFGIALWGLIVAVGVYQRSHRPAAADIVLCTVAVFLGIWLLALTLRKRPPDASRGTDDRDTPNQ